MGYGLLPDAWEQDLMSEALATGCRRGFEVLGLHSIEADANPANGASIRLLEWQGFVREAHFRQNYFRGQFQGAAIYWLLAPQAGAAAAAVN